MNIIKYDSPARFWREALPIGNGHTGVMIYGGRKSERLCFNDGTLWSGYPRDYNSEKSLPALERARELIFSGKNAGADALVQKEMQGFYSETFLPLGEVRINIGGSGGTYSRELDLMTAVHKVTCGDVVREAFASNPAGLVAYKINSKSPITVTLRMKSALHSGVSSHGGALYLTGNAPDHVTPNYVRQDIFPVKYKENRGMAFALGVTARTDGKVKISGEKMIVSSAREITFYFATATGFRGYDKMPDTDTHIVRAACKAKLSWCADFEKMKSEHIRDFSSLYNRQSISLGSESDENTDELLKNAKDGGDIRALCELFYNFGKYMTISASRQGGQPMNLQGIWNASVRPPWSSNYTVNINTQMNYWGASACGLSECIEPLLQMVWETVQTGRKTAKINYGCSGFACNHNVDIWRKTPPVLGAPNYMLEPLCGVWLANEICTHYKNGALSQYRERVVEIAEEAARFAADYLVMHEGEYVICPSPSPENSFRRDGKSCSLDYASAFDMGLVREAFANALELSDDEDLKSIIAEKSGKLRGFKDGKYGICEWHTDFDTPEKGHRHFSPLYAFYPGHIIGYRRDGEKREWVRKLFEYRIDNSSQYIGWSAAWAICLAARLRDAVTAEKVTRNFLCHSVFKNLFCVHPPFLFQIDGNMGYVAGLNEMLVTSEDGVAELLPALPDGWTNGSVKNIIVDGAKLSFGWEDGAIINLSSDLPMRVRAAYSIKNADSNIIIEEISE